MANSEDRAEELARYGFPSDAPANLSIDELLALKSVPLRKEFVEAALLAERLSLLRSRIEIGIQASSTTLSSEDKSLMRNSVTAAIAKTEKDMASQDEKGGIFDKASHAAVNLLNELRYPTNPLKSWKVPALARRGIDMPPNTRQVNMSSRLIPSTNENFPGINVIVAGPTDENGLVSYLSIDYLPKGLDLKDWQFTIDLGVGKRVTIDQKNAPEFEDELVGFRDIFVAIHARLNIPGLGGLISL